MDTRQVERVDMDDTEHREIRERLAELSRQQERYEQARKRRRWFRR